jgi:CMP-N,N'-diacetyllegionaminic acid synthase
MNLVRFLEMIERGSVLAIIPARGGSKGLPGKNIRPLCGKPLLAWPLEAAVNSRYIDRVVVSTEDETIAAVALKWGGDVPFVRPAELATDTAKSSDVILHALNFIQNSDKMYDYIVLLEPTSPLTESRDIDSALEQLYTNRSNADSIVGVCNVEGHHPNFCVRINQLNGLIEPYQDPDFSAAGRRQDLDPVFAFDGSLYISASDVYLEKKSFYHTRTLPRVFPKWKSFEIDDIVDYLCVEAMMKNRNLFT